MGRARRKERLLYQWVNTCSGERMAFGRGLQKGKGKKVLKEEDFNPKRRLHLSNFRYFSVAGE